MDKKVPQFSDCRMSAKVQKDCYGQQNNFNEKPIFGFKLMRTNKDFVIQLDHNNSWSFVGHKILILEINLYSKVFFFFFGRFSLF